MATEGGRSSAAAAALAVLIIVFIALGVLLVLLRSSRGRDGRLSRSAKPDWISSGPHNPANRYPDLVKEFGPPSLVDLRAGGVAIWYKKDLQTTPTGRQYDRIEIRDEQIPHGDHSDFLYTWMRIPLSVEKTDEVRGLSDSVTYDPLTKLVRARCHFMGANVVTLMLAKRIANGEISLNAARLTYKPTIDSLNNNPEAYQTHVRELQKYLR